MAKVKFLAVAPITAIWEKATQKVKVIFARLANSGKGRITRIGPREPSHDRTARTTLTMLLTRAIESHRYPFQMLGLVFVPAKNRPYEIECQRFPQQQTSTKWNGCSLSLPNVANSGPRAESDEQLSCSELTGFRA